MVVPPVFGKRISLRTQRRIEAAEATLREEQHRQRRQQQEEGGGEQTIHHTQQENDQLTSENASITGSMSNSSAPNSRRASVQKPAADVLALLHSSVNLEANASLTLSHNPNFAHTHTHHHHNHHHRHHRDSVISTSNSSVTSAVGGATPNSLTSQEAITTLSSLFQPANTNFTETNPNNHMDGNDSSIYPPSAPAPSARGSSIDAAAVAAAAMAASEAVTASGQSTLQDTNNLTMELHQKQQQIQQQQLQIEHQQQQLMLHQQQHHQHHSHFSSHPPHPSQMHPSLVNNLHSSYGLYMTSSSPVHPPLSTPNMLALASGSPLHLGGASSTNIITPNPSLVLTPTNLTPNYATTTNPTGTPTSGIAPNGITISRPNSYQMAPLLQSQPSFNSIGYPSTPFSPFPPIPIVPSANPSSINLTASGSTTSPIPVSGGGFFATPTGMTPQQHHQQIHSPYQFVAPTQAAGMGFGNSTVGMSNNLSFHPSSFPHPSPPSVSSLTSPSPSFPSSLPSSSSHALLSASVTSAHATMPYRTTKLPILHPWYMARFHGSHANLPPWEPPPTHLHVDTSSSDGFARTLRLALKENMSYLTRCLPSSDLTSTPVWVNDKQHSRTIHRRSARQRRAAMLAAMSGGQSTGNRKSHAGAPKHLSRQLHAARRVRGAGGRFLTKEEREQLDREANQLNQQAITANTLVMKHEEEEIDDEEDAMQSEDDE